MAKNKVSERVKAMRAKALGTSTLAKVNEEPLHEYVQRAMKLYGMYVVMGRALVDFRDGLKPVHRRVLWGMHQMHLRPNGAFRKSAKVVGDVMGNFHPHGDSSIYGAMVGVADTEDVKNTPVPLVWGQGNWGWYNASPAAYRYTECKLSEYSYRMLLNEDYLNDETTDFVQNYDGSRKEPLILPSLLPTVFLNGTAGIAVGVSAGMPPFHIKGVVTLVEMALRGEKITAKDCLKHLKFNYPYGAKCISPDRDVLDYFKTGEGNLKFQGEMEIDGRTCFVTKLPPNFNYEGTKSKDENKKPSGFYNKAMDLDEVRNVSEANEGNQIRIQVELKDSVATKNAKTYFEKHITPLITQTVKFQTNMTIRKLGTEDSEVDEAGADFKSVSIPELLQMWVDWRIALEVRAQKYRQKKIEERITYLELLRFAITKLDVIFKILKSKSENLDKDLAKALKRSEAEAKQILDLQARRLSRLSDAQLTRELKDLRAELLDVKGYIKKPAKKVLADIEKLDVRDFEITVADTTKKIKLDRRKKAA